MRRRPRPTALPPLLAASLSSLPGEEMPDSDREGREDPDILKERASTIYGRPRASTIYVAAAAKKSWCFEGCWAVLMGLPPEGPSGHGGEKRPLAKLPPCKSWADLDKEGRGLVAVEVASLAKENVRGWVNQDATCACGLPGQDGRPGPLLFGVFDGHGRSGHDVSRLAAERLPAHLQAQPEHPLSNPRRALEAAFRSTDDDIYANLGHDVEYSGTTGVVVLFDPCARVLHIANVGDSRAVLGQCAPDAKSPRWDALALTADLKPDLPEERERIELSGGVVSALQEHGRSVGPARVWESAVCEKPGLAVSRSLGDGCARSLGVVATPVVTSHTLRPEDRFLLIATDGLWDSLDNDKAIRISSKFISLPHVAAKALCEAVRREEGGALVDDTTVTIVVL